MGMNLWEEDDNTIELMKELLGNEQEVNNSRSLFQNQDMVKLVKTYLDEDIPKEIKETKLYKEFWGVIGKTIKLTFLEKEDVIDFEYLFENAKLTYMMCKPTYEYGFGDLQLLDQIKIYYMAAVKRSLGFGSHRFNERIILGGSINQTIRSNTENIKSGSSGGGFLNKLRGMF